MSLPNKNKDCQCAMNCDSSHKLGIVVFEFRDVFLDAAAAVDHFVGFLGNVRLGLHHSHTLFTEYGYVCYITIRVDRIFFIVKVGK